MKLLGRELTTDEIIRFVRDFAAQTRRHKDCHDCLYIDMALELADEVERLNRRAAPENKALTVTLPCKTGDTVYYIAWHEKQPIKHGTVWQFGMDETHVWASITVSKTSVVTMNVDNLYLTREAAEQALAARRPEDTK